MAGPELTDDLRRTAQAAWHRFIARAAAIPAKPPPMITMRFRARVPSVGGASATANFSAGSANMAFMGSPFASLCWGSESQW